MTQHQQRTTSTMIRTARFRMNRQDGKAQVSSVYEKVQRHPLDWKDKNPQSIYNRTVKQMNRSPKNSGIILFHDIHAQTVIASQLVLNYLLENEYKVCPVGEVVNHLNGLNSPCVTKK